MRCRDDAGPPCPDMMMGCVMCACAGFDTLGAGSLLVQRPPGRQPAACAPDESAFRLPPLPPAFIVQDSREVGGWCRGSLDCSRSCVLAEFLFHSPRAGVGGQSARAAERVPAPAPSPPPAASHIRLLSGAGSGGTHQRLWRHQSG